MQQTSIAPFACFYMHRFLSESSKNSRDPQKLCSNQKKVNIQKTETPQNPKEEIKTIVSLLNERKYKSLQFDDLLIFSVQICCLFFPCVCNTKRSVIDDVKCVQDISKSLSSELSSLTCQLMTTNALFVLLNSIEQKLISLYKHVQTTENR